MSRLINCTLDRHGAAILEIFNTAIVHTTALYDTEPRPPESMQSWFETKRAHSFPVIGLESVDGELIGFATYGSFRPHAAYRNTVEHSVYVKSDYSGKGYGKTLLSELIEQARLQDLHTLVGVIDSDNAASIRLHQKLGFVFAGTLKEVGYKFDRWLNVDFYQLQL